ncbi:hypothetical protein [Streptomyces sp. MMG1522]|uniref:hypothetical protein n=1 Tax=Streptomyces sp. MMG1522 TaxID=1415545 RepID=UPI000AF6877A
MIRQRLDATEALPTDPTGTRRRTDPWHQATAATERVPHHLDRADDEAAQAHIAAFGEALDALPLVAPPISVLSSAKPPRPSNEQPAPGFGPGTTRPEPCAEPSAPCGPHQPAVTAVDWRCSWTWLSWPSSPPSDGTGSATTTSKSQPPNRPCSISGPPTVKQPPRPWPPSPTADHRPPTTDHRPPTDKVARLAQHIRTVVPDHGETVLADPAWPALATALSEAETAGHDPRQLLQAATHQRTLDDAVSPAEVLTWRIRRLAHRPPPSDRALAAQARSTRAARPMAVHQNEPVAATLLSPTPRPSPRR